MRNPFKTPLPLTYNPYPNVVQADTNSTVHSNDVYLDDVVYPDQVARSQSASDLGDYQTQPDYDASAMPDGMHRELLFVPGPQFEYTFISPAAGQVDKSTPEDVGGIPGTNVRNIVWGPVTGNAMDEWQVGSRTQLESVPAGYSGPVTGSPDADYATQLAYSTYQQQIADYSSAVATDAMVNAV